MQKRSNVIRTTRQLVSDLRSAQRRISDWTVSAAIVDLDNDGIAEIVDANYIQGTDVFSKLCDTGGLPRICSPLNFQPAKNRILKQDENGGYPIAISFNRVGTAPRLPVLAARWARG